MQEVLDRSGQYNASDAKELIEAGDWQIWLCYHGTTLDSFVVTTVKQYPRRRDCVILAASGVKMEGWLHHLGKVETWAKGLGCTKMVAIGRSGWERVLCDYEKTHIVVEKDL